ncbi:unnamed protein product [Prunus armeniaca]|uniref:Uncharacterized protein n=1 Tax=Prunus armeniaca TaxID=36596 RepID=A0A6J5WHS1_PRUAR|nr:unnamed protein product [Prunus armeniaca]CAB4299625.1 unnamed protein product [Prunus armeniaca]
MTFNENGIRPNPKALFAFEGNKAQAIGDVTLPVIAVGKTLLMTFAVVDALSAHNMIMGRVGSIKWMGRHQPDVK